MITKELFTECITAFQNYDEWEHKLYELGINFWEREELANLLSAYLKLLGYCCKDYPVDKYDYSNIDYYIYETEYGKKADKYFITEQDGTEIKFKNLDNLWNYLVKNNPDIEDKNIE